MKFYKLTILSGIFLLCFACKSEPETKVIPKYAILAGKTMGTTYSIKYLDKQMRNFQAKIDQLLVEVNADVSTYEPESFITRFNKSKEEIQYFNILDNKTKLPIHFKANFEKSKEVFKNSNGFFDPTIMPIVNYWGFGYTEKRAVKDVDKIKVDSLMEFVGFDKINQRSTKEGWVFLNKEKSGIQLDFSAIAKGYGVDAVAQFLESNNVENYYVEIGGELIVKGKNPENKWWTIGVNVPVEGASVTEIQSIVELKNQAVATSGNYRNFYEVDGVKYAHTINPKTGFPEKNTLLSATIFAKDCMTADAYATACMTMGLDRGKSMIEKLEGIDAYFLYSDQSGDIQTDSTNPDLKINYPSSSLGAKSQ